MRNVRMTGRERVQRMFARQDHDSIPRHESFWSDTIDRFRREGFHGSVLEFLGGDFHGVCWIDPMPYPGQDVLLAEDEETRTVRDPFNNVLRYWKHRMGTPEHVEFGCKTRDDWFHHYKPLYEQHWKSFNLDATREDLAVARRNGRWAHFTGLETFEMTRRLMGDETILIAMAEDPSWVVDVSRTLTDCQIRNFQALLDAGIRPDGVWIYGDMAYRRGTMCGPKHYRELVWPDHKRMADWAHDRGMPFIFHTDGDVNDVMDLYVRAGFDCLQPLEAKAGMDVRKLCPHYGRKMAFFGNCDVMVYATNDRDLIEEEVRSKLCAGKATGAYAYHSDHSVPPSVSWETYRFVMELVDRYGNYD